MTFNQTLGKSSLYKKIAFAGFIGAMALSQNSFAEGKGATSTTTSTSSNLKLMYGLSSNEMMLGTAVPAISVLLRLNPKIDIQTYFVLVSVNGTTSSSLGAATGSGIQLGAGAAVKYNAIGDADKGLHVGGGITMGDAGAGFYTNLAGLAGLHFQLVPSVLVSVDTGVRFRLGGADEDVQIAGSSGLLGASIHIAL